MTVISIINLHQNLEGWGPFTDSNTLSVCKIIYIFMGLQQIVNN